MRLSSFVRDLLLGAAAVAGAIVWSAGAAAQEFSRDAVVKFDGNITRFDESAKQDDFSLHGQMEFTLIVDDLFEDDLACGLTEELLENVAIDANAHEPFDLVGENRYAVLWIEVDSDRYGDVCLSNLRIAAQYDIHVQLPGQRSPWFASIPLWEGFGKIATDNNPDAHRRKVIDLLRARLKALGDEWRHHNS